MTQKLLLFQMIIASVYNNDLSQILNLFESETYMTVFNDAIIKNNRTYIATEEKGVLVIENSGNRLFISKARWSIRK